MKRSIEEYYKTQLDSVMVPDGLLERTLRAALQTEVSGTPRSYERPRIRKPTVIAVLIAVAILGAAVVYASVTGLWSRGLSGTIHSDPEVQQALIDEGFAYPLAEAYREYAMTCSGVTITPNMILTDGRVAYISFLIEGYGYEIAENERPAFLDEKDAPLQFILEGDDPDTRLLAARIYADGFYSDVTIPTEGMPYYSDGTPAEFNPDGTVIGRYQDDNGNMEYIIKVMTTAGDIIYGSPYEEDWRAIDSLYGAVMHVEFKDLGTVDSTLDKSLRDKRSQEDLSTISLQDLYGYKNVAYGTWTFDIRMPDREDASEMIRTVELNAPIDDTDCFVETVEMSPISVNLTYTTSRQKNRRGGDNAFELRGFRLKDGTILRTATWDRPLVLYGDSEEDRMELIALDHTVDPEQVEAILVNLYAYEDEIEIILP